MLCIPETTVGQMRANGKTDEGHRALQSRVTAANFPHTGGNRQLCTDTVAVCVCERGISVSIVCARMLGAALFRCRPERAPK